MYELLKNKNKLNRLTRNWFEEQGFLEVETSILNKYSSLEKYIYPMKTSVIDDYASSDSYYLRVSPELSLKKVLARILEDSEGVGSSERLGSGGDLRCLKIFEMGKCFRNHENEKSPEHLFEFNLLEWYEMASSLEGLMERFVSLVGYLVKVVSGGSRIKYGNGIYDVESWRKITVREAFLKYGEIDFDELATWDDLKPVVIQKISQKKIGDDVIKKMEGWSLDDVFYWMFLNYIEPQLKKVPTLLYEYPEFQASFSKLKQDDKGTNKRYGLRFEAYLGGMELANGFEELCDAAEQKRRWEDGQRWFGKQGEDCQMDEDFLAALEVIKKFEDEKDIEKGFKVEKSGESLVGVAVGWDRLMMILTNQNDIKKLRY